MPEELISLRVPSSIQEFPLNENSIVFIVGAWEGKHAQFYIDTYNPVMYLFEPQTEKYLYLKSKFSNNPKVHVINAGLGESSRMAELSRVGTDRCSFIHRLPGKDGNESTFAGNHSYAEITEFREFMKQENINHVDLVLMNCEGYEFILLPHLIKTGLANMVEYFMVQFHMHHEGAERIEPIREGMLKTHSIINDYFPAWITWGLNPPVIEEPKVARTVKPRSRPKTKRTAK